MATPRPALGHALNPSPSGRPTGTATSTAPRSGTGARPGWLRTSTLLGLAASACVGLLTLPGTASADPTPADLTQQVADASHQLEVISEQVNQAQVQLSQEQSAAQQADRAAADATSQLKVIQGKVAQIARSAYTTGDVSRLDTLLTSKSPEDFLAQMGTLDLIAGRQTQVLKEAAATARTAEKDRATAESAAASAQQTLDGITAKQSQLQTQVADYKKQYAALTAPQQDAVVRRVSGAPAAAPVGPVVASSGAAQAAVNTALAQVGKPYVWGASGPGSFDCSGLTMYAYAAAGVALPHSSSGQSRMGTPVSRDQLQPGDLVFFYTPVSHVAMYIGNGQIVHASTSGQPVKVVSLDSVGSYNSARRFG